MVRSIGVCKTRCIKVARKRYQFDPSGRRHKRGGSNPLMTALIVVAVAALVFIGWNIYVPLQRVLKGDAGKTVESAASHVSSASHAASKPSSSSGSTSSAATTAMRGIYLPGGTLTTATISQTLQAAKSAGVTTAIAELKSDDGVLHYASKISEVQNNGIVASGALDGAAIAQAITQSGMTPAARISCFKDPLAPTVMRDAAVKYAGNHSTNWLDESGNRWLNPYSATTVQYLTDLAAEAASMGFKQIYLDNVQFPSGAQNHVWYGDNLPSKESALQSFVAAVTQKVHTTGGTVTLVLPANAAVGSGQASLGQDQDPFGYGADTVSPLLTPVSLDGLTVGGTALPNPISDFGAAVSAAAQGLKTLNASKYGDMVPFIQAGTVSGSGTVTADTVNAEVSALKAAGIDHFVFYATGGYNLTGVAAK